MHDLKSYPRDWSFVKCILLQFTEQSPFGLRQKWYTRACAEKFRLRFGSRSKPVLPLESLCVRSPETWIFLQEQS